MWPMMQIARRDRPSGNSDVSSLRDRTIDLWSVPGPCCVDLGKVDPMHVFIVKAALEVGLHNHEVGRNIEVARRIK